MKNNKTALVLTILVALVITGCGPFKNTIPNLDDEQKSLVVEYAAESLLKYDPASGDKVGRKPDDFDIEEHEEIIEEPEIVEPEPVDDTQSEETDYLEDMTVVDNTDTGVSSYGELEDALGLNGSLDFTYDGYEIKDSYPESLDSYFVLNATKNCKLLIIKFKVSNVSGDNISVNMPANDAKFKIALNGSSKNALTTMLTNDISYYENDLGPSDSDEVVIVGEYREEELVNIDSLSVILKRNDGNLTINLQ